ncbi:MAG: MerR family transcriptional regulator [Duncaniella sp.]|nr:MerR family transcriptional regulator [Duncaniella sp.]HBI58453.1 transcriptional regulator [Porphyromonadaceae bacterium]
MSTSLSKKYYTIGETADILNLPASTLRYWESVFPMIRPQRTSHGRRTYTPADIEKLRMVKYLLHDRGMHIEAAREELKRNRDGVLKHSEAIDTLKRVRAELVSVLDALHALR